MNPIDLKMNISKQGRICGVLFAALTLLFTGCQGKKTDGASDAGKDSLAADSTAKKLPRPVSEPLVTHIYTADPSAHVFNGRIYIYPSHDIESNTPQDDEGGHFDMKDYHVLSMDSIGGKVTDHGVA
jgi:hypothetical protein